MSTAVLSVTGVASADIDRTYTFSTDPGAAADVHVDEVLPVSDAFCSITWELVGGSGGKDSLGNPGKPGGRLGITVPLDIPADQVAEFYLFPGGAGGDGQSSFDPHQDLGSAGHGGMSGHDGNGTDGSKYLLLQENEYFYGGGGGAESAVAIMPATPPAEQGTAAGSYLQTVLSAFGGDGAGADEGAGAGGGYGKYTNNSPFPGDTGLAAVPGAGVISGTVTLCKTDVPTPDVVVKPRVSVPVEVAAVAGASSIKISWKAPQDAAGVAGYQAFASPVGAQSSGGTVFCKPAAALGTSCVVPAIPGLTYNVGVESLDAKGERIGVSDRVTTTAIAAPVVAASLPKASGTLTSDAKDGKAVAGEKVTVTGKDFLPGSVVELVAYSTPVSLGQAVVLSDGTFTAEVTLPEDMANGTHHLVASGVDVNGDPRTLVVEVTVSGGVATAEIAGLAYTGFTPAPWLAGGALTLLAGGGLLVAARRRSA
ncbi:hypothetical protein [Modestobacter roseus]|uniref:hypothetical protein n=1 Tax=Modestobacter roseus TaxID=1181884 RepID=UPI0012956B6F|nr:hypothetical protein [Modestobacter roseus]